MEKATADAALSRQPLQVEFRILLPGGRVKWVHLVSAAAPVDGGNEVRVGMAFDITSRKAAEAAEATLQEHGRIWKQALESSGDGVWDWYVQTGVEYLSPQFRALYGYSAAELPDRSEALDAITHPDDIPRMCADREAHFQGSTSSYVNEHRLRCKDGQWKWVLSRGIVISRDADGKPLRMIGTHTDISAHKLADALRHERDRAAAADVAKSQFLSRVSHELRTPLNAILGFAQLLELEPGVGDKQLAWNRQVLVSGRHLLALMDDILQLSSAQAGYVAVTPEPVALRPVVEETWTMLAASALAQEVAFIDAMPQGVAVVVMADRKRLKQIISNLLSNAIKYNRQGGWVRVAVFAHEGTVELSVADSGPGLDQAQQARLFNPFDRLGAQSGPVAGTGLGLALSQQFAQAMGGSIGVHSRAGEGATFSLRLPAA